VCKHHVRRKLTFQREIYGELEEVVDHFPKYRIKILLGDCNAKLGKDDIFKPTIGNESLHQESNNNVVRIVDITT